MNNWQVAWREMRLGMGPGPWVPGMLGIAALSFVLVIWRLAGMWTAIVIGLVTLLAFGLVLATGAANVGQRRDEERFGPVPGTYGTIDINAPMRRKPAGYTLRTGAFASWFGIAAWSVFLLLIPLPGKNGDHASDGLWLGLLLILWLWNVLTIFITGTVTGWRIRVSVYQGLWRMRAPRFLRRFWYRISQPARQSYYPALRNPG